MIQRGRDYSQVIDLRFFDVPALLHVANWRDCSADDKWEFIGAGGIRVPEMIGYMREVLRVDVLDCNVMRLDAAADLPGALVPWCREHVRVARKRAVDCWTPGAAVRDISQDLAETVYWGKGRLQFKAYDKTGERRALLLKIRRKMTREERDALSLEEHFKREYDLSIFEQITRVERRVGSRAAAKKFGVEKFQQLEQCPFIDPYEAMQFPEHALLHHRFTGKLPHGIDEFSIRYLRELVRKDGLSNARNEMRRVWSKSAFYRNYNAILPLISVSGQDHGPRREDVRKSWVSHVLKQLAA